MDAFVLISRSHELLATYTPTRNRVRGELELTFHELRAREAGVGLERTAACGYPSRAAYPLCREARYGELDLASTTPETDAAHGAAHHR
jgi:hypothetical protein